MPTRQALKDLTTPAEGATEVYVLAGLAGHVLQFRPLAQKLHPRWHLRGILYPPFVSNDMACASIEELVDRMMPMLGDLPRDPVFLGYSIGGTIAFEMASRLTAEGHRPGIVMIDSNPRFLRQRSPPHEKFLLRLTTGTRRLFLRWPRSVIWRLQSAVKLAGEPQSRKQRFDDGVPVPAWIAPEAPLMQFYRESWFASGRYQPKPAPVRVVMVRSVGPNDSAWLRRIYWPRKDHNWRLVADVVGVVPCVGNHVSIVDTGNLDTLSEAVGCALQMAFDARDRGKDGAVRED